MSDQQSRPLRFVTLLATTLAIASLWLHPGFHRPILIGGALLLIWPSFALSNPVPWPHWKRLWNTVLALAALAALALWTVVPSHGLPLLVSLILLACLRLAYNPGRARQSRKLIALGGILMVLTSQATISPWFPFMALPFLLFALGALLWSEVGQGLERTAIERPAELSLDTIPTHGRQLWLPPLAMTALTALLGAVLFPVFPRASSVVGSSGIRDSAIEGQVALTGMSNRIELGAFDWLLRDPTPAIRVTWIGTAPPEPLNLRAGALARLEQVQGRWEWSNSIPRQPIERSFEAGVLTPLSENLSTENITANAIGQRVELLDPDLRSLFSLPWMIGVRSTQGGTLIRENGGRWRSRNLEERWAIYEAWSLPGDDIDRLPGDRPIEDHTYVPVSLRGPLHEFIDEHKIASRRDPPEQRVDAILHHLRTTHDHTLDLRHIGRADPLADFIFHGRDGNCELFASAMTVMCRSMGVPARLATGFHGGVLTPEGARIFRREDAHAWVEVWLDGRGWVAKDPTPPDPLAAPSPEGMWRQVSSLVGGVAGRWRSDVIQYEGVWHRRFFTWSLNRIDRLASQGTGQPGALPRALSKVKRNFDEEPALWVVVTLIVILNLTFAWLDLRMRRFGWNWPWRRPCPIEPSEKLLRRLAHTLIRKPRGRRRGETAAEYLHSLADRAPAGELERLISLFYEWRFNPDASTTPSELHSHARQLAQHIS